MTCCLGDPALVHTPTHTAIVLYGAFMLPWFFLYKPQFFHIFLNLLTKEYLIYLKTF